MSRFGAEFSDDEAMSAEPESRVSSVTPKRFLKLPSIGKPLQSQDRTRELKVHVSEPGRDAKANRISFGSVTIEGRPLDVTVEHIERNIRMGREALARFGEALIAPGVKLSRDRDIPKYRVDPDHPAILIRELNGRSERVAFRNGKFEVAE